MELGGGVARGGWTGKHRDGRRSRRRVGIVVIIWNRSARQLPLFSDHKVAIAAMLAVAVEAAEIVVLCVASYDAARSLVSDIMQLDGRCVVQLATGTPQDAGEMAQFITSKGAQYLDGKVLGGPEAIRTHSGRVFLAGPFDVLESHRRALNFLGGEVQHAGGNSAPRPLSTFRGCASALACFWVSARVSICARLMVSILGSWRAFFRRGIGAVFSWTPSPGTHRQILAHHCPLGMKP